VNAALPPPVVPISPDRIQARWWNRYVLIPVMASLVLAIVAGGAVGWLVTIVQIDECDPAAEWCELGALILGLVAGGACALVTHLAVGVTLIVRTRPATKRTPDMIALIVTPIAIYLALSGLSVL
jgi:hypothetical protein